MKLLLLCSTALAASTTPQKHLVVLVHGLSGTAADLGYLARRLEADASVRVLASGANEPFPRTLDGVDAGGMAMSSLPRCVGTCAPAFAARSAHRPTPPLPHLPC